MAIAAEVVTALKELTTAKQLERGELLELLKDGIHAALVKKYGPNVRSEIAIDEMKGTIRVVILRTVIEAVEDPGSQVSLEEARFEDPSFQPGDVLEEEVPFETFGRTAVQAAKQRIIQRVREGERSRIREEFTDKVGDLLTGEVQQIERGKIVVMLNKFREAEAIIPYRDQNHREHFHQGDSIRAVLKRIEETPKGPRLVLSRADPLFVNPAGPDGILGFDSTTNTDQSLDDNFHVPGNSPTIDAGDPTDAFSNEPGPNGGRINQGSYGNTIEATVSPARLVQVLSPNGLEKFQVGRPLTISWRTAGLGSTVPYLVCHRSVPPVFLPVSFTAHS